MKLQACLITFVVAEKSSSSSENPEPKRWGDDPVNEDACIYTEKNGIVRVTTVPGLGALTKCYKLFQCDDGAKVQARLNQFGLGWRFGFTPDCQKNFVQFSYSIPRDDFMDFYHWTDHLCDEDLERGWELGEWATLEDVVRFSFEFTDEQNAEIYDWFYDYTDHLYESYAGYDPHPYPTYPIEEKSKFDIQFKCSKSSVPIQISQFPATETTTTDPTTTTINQNYNTVDKDRFLSNLRTTLE